MQKSAPSSGWAVFPVGGSAEPATCTLPPMIPLSGKHSRKPKVQVWNPGEHPEQVPPSPGGRQSLSAKQSMNVWLEHVP
jgi:hypothetical protein